MAKIRAVLVAAVLLFQPGLALAAPGWSASGTISDIISSETGIAVIIPNGTSPVGCSASTWFRLGTGTANYQATSAIIIAARAQNRPIKFWINQCDTDGASLVVAAWSN